MATIELTNVPEDLFKEIARRAKTDRRTISEETISMLKKQIDTNSPQQEKIKRALDKAATIKWPDLDLDWVVNEIRKDRESR